jgi:hypothetical protein
MSPSENPALANSPDQAVIEAGLRSFRPHPSEAFYRRMAAAPWLAASLVTPRRASMNKPSKFFKWAVPILVGLIMVIGFAATPWGQALATEVFKLFVHVERNTFPLSPEEITRVANPSSETPVPILNSALSVTELETQLGFDIKEPTVLPDFFSFQGIRVYGKSVDFVYQCSCGGRSLDISQQPLSDATPAEVGVDTPIEEVQIGTMKGAYAEGSFVIFPGAKVATWNSEAPMRKLRWVDGEILFQMTSMGGSEEHAGYISKAEMIAIAEGLK